MTHQSPSNDLADGVIAQFLHLLPDTIDKQSSAHVVEALADIIGCSHILMLKYNEDDAVLEYERALPRVQPPPAIYVKLFNAEEHSIVSALRQGSVITYDQRPDEERLASLTAFVPNQHVTLLPILSHARLIGLIVFYNSDDTPLTDTQLEMINDLQMILGYSLASIFVTERLLTKMNSIEQESEIFSRIDSELNDTIELDYVFAMLKDWALRFSNAKAATLCLYDRKTDTLRLMSDYGLRPNTLKINQELSQEQGGITLRVAHTGRAEIVPDVDADSDYYALADGMRTQMSVPIKREEQVIGVLTLYTTKLNGFTDDHLEFVKRLSGRAGVAVDNARLFSETERESEKLSYILRNIGDNVILVGLDHEIEMINASAILAFQLLAEGKHVGNHISDVLNHSGLQSAYQKAVETDETISQELELPNGRIYHTTIEFHENVGRVIVMQDITHYKETDRLKTELVATVSHDLKQPLSVMRGYMDLLRMVNTFDDASSKYIKNLYFAFDSMQQLIDDLLDIARIEAGIKLELEEVNVVDVLNFAVRSNSPQANMKQITIHSEYPKNLPTLTGDPKRLEQIFNNLVGNAVKYTPPEGQVTISTELRQDSIRVFIKDNGMGIGPEDQAQIFERFYRVRRPETDSIEGTGLGLAIVKSLVEAHNGKIDLKSALNEGSTFRVTLPR